MGIMESKIEGTKAQQTMAKEMTKPWHRRLETWLTIINLLVLATNIFVTFWYTYEPRQIRERCFAEAEFNPTAISTMDEMKRYEFIDTYYRACLHRFGVE